MKVMIVNRHHIDNTGGSEVQADIIARGLHSQGHEVVYLAVNGRKGSDYNRLPYRVVPIERLEPRAFSKALSDEMPEVIYWRHNKKTLRKAVSICKRKRVPFVFAVSHINDLRKYSHKWSSPGLGPVHFVASLLYTIKTVIESRWNYPALKNVDGAIFQLVSQSENAPNMRKTAIIGNSAEDNLGTFLWNRPYCLWVSNIKASKRPESYLELAEVFRTSREEIDFLMIGKLQEKVYARIVEETEASTNFHYLGFLDNSTINSALRGAVCLVTTGLPEGYPNIMIQSWMQGCPTLALEYDPDGLISEHGLGFVCGDIRSMAGYLEGLMTNPDVRMQIGARAEAFAKENCSPEAMVLKIEEFLLDVVNNMAIE